jgi:hypothetical protein
MGKASYGFFNRFFFCAIECKHDYFPDKSHLPLCSLSVKPKTEQSRDKPLFYAILGVCIYMTIFKGCHTDTLAVMS